MNYDTQQALSLKADNWKVHSLEQTVDKQKYNIQELERTVSKLENKLSNYYYVFDGVIQQLLEMRPEDEYHLMQLRQQL